MKIHITIHPIDFDLMEKLGINDRDADQERLPDILQELYDSGYTQSYTYFAAGPGPAEFNMHFKGGENWFADR